MPPLAHTINLNYDDLKDNLAAANGDEELFRAIVNAPFNFKVEAASLFLGIVVLLLVDKKAGTINRIALSDTEMAKNTTAVSVKPFEEIKIPLSSEENILAAAIRDGQPHDTTDWKFLFTPVLTGDQARINQASAGIAYSAVYPLKARDGGAMIFSYYQYQGSIGEAQRNFMDRYVEIVDDSL